MRLATKIAVVAAVAAGGLSLGATAARAEIICNQFGDCWHVRHHHYHYQPTWGLVVHPDEWRWRDDERERYHWREHEGRGYWGPNGVWIRF